MQRRRPDGLFEATVAARRRAPETSPTASACTKAPARATSSIPTSSARSSTDFDLHLFSEGTHYRAWEKLGAHRADDRRRRPACTSPSGRPTRSASASSATSTGGTAACTRCGGSCRRASGRSSFPTCRTAPATSSRSAPRPDICCRRRIPYARRFEVPPNTASIIWTDGGYEWRDDDWMRDRRVARRLARAADVGLRGAPRVVAPRARGRQPLPDLPRAGARRSCRTCARWATRTSS